jgi:tetratricopeptide (TPR) repeat protein
VKAGAVGAAWAPYVNALVATGDLRNARVTLDQARASVPSTMTVPELELSEARLEYAQKRYTQAARAADKAMKQFQARYAARLKRGGEEATQAAAAGVGTDYYDAALVKAYSFVGLSRWKDAVAMFDVYIAENPTAADILIDRGNAKAELKDAKGAEKDFREALRFVPYDNEAKAGLKRIGAAR